MHISADLHPGFSIVGLRRPSSAELERCCDAAPVGAGGGTRIVVVTRTKTHELTLGHVTRECPARTQRPF